MNKEHRDEIWRRLSPKQREALTAYDKRHKEMMAQPDKLKQWESVLMMFEEFFEVCKHVGIPLEPQIQAIVKSGKQNLHLNGNLAQDFEKTLRDIAALVEAS